MPKSPETPKDLHAWDEDEAVEIPRAYSGKIIQLFPRIKVKVPFRKKVKLMDGEEIVLSDETKALLEVEFSTKGCFLCRFILEDFAAHGKLTGAPNDMFEKGTFPVESKVRHVEILKYNLPEKVQPGAKPPAEEDEQEGTDGK